MSSPWHESRFRQAERMRWAPLCPRKEAIFKLRNTCFLWPHSRQFSSRQPRDGTTLFLGSREIALVPGHDAEKVFSSGAAAPGIGKVLRIVSLLICGGGGVDHSPHRIHFKSRRFTPTNAEPDYPRCHACHSLQTRL